MSTRMPGVNVEPAIVMLTPPIMGTALGPMVAMRGKLRLRHVRSVQPLSTPVYSGDELSAGGDNGMGPAGAV